MIERSITQYVGAMLDERANAMEADFVTETIGGDTCRIPSFGKSDVNSEKRNIAPVNHSSVSVIARSACDEAIQPRLPSWIASLRSR
jgi:hypothetical protein